MQGLLRTSKERIILDLGRLGGEPLKFQDIEPDGGPCWPPPAVGTVLPAEILPATEDDDEMRLPRRVIVRPDGRWASLE